MLFPRPPASPVLISDSPRRLAGSPAVDGASSRLPPHRSAPTSLRPRRRPADASPSLSLEAKQLTTNSSPASRSPPISPASPGPADARGGFGGGSALSWAVEQS